LATDGSDPAGTGEKHTSRERLESWKDIANYLHRGVRTVQRWEKEEGLPVYRHLHTKLGTVYSYKVEVDAWWDDRRNDLEPTDCPADYSDPENRREATGFRKSRAGITLISLIIVIVFVLFLGLEWPSSDSGLSFKARDWVLIASFENRSGESVLDGTLEFALERDLCNSTFVNIVPRERVNDTLRLMQRPLDTHIDRALGREICLRDGGIRALLTGRVTKLQTAYVLSATIVDPKSGVGVAGVSEEAASQADILAAVRRLSHQVRQELGEKLPRMSSSPEKLETATTPSLRALQYFSRAMGFVNQHEWAQGAPLLELAIREDSQFASAHIYLAHCYSCLDNEEAAAPHYEKAFALSEATADHERYFIEGTYYKQFTNDPEKALRAYQTLVDLYPDHNWGLACLADSYRKGGMRKQAALYSAQRARFRPNDFLANYSAARACVEDLSDPGGAKPYLLRAQALLTPETTQRYSDGALWVFLYPAEERWREDQLPEAAKEIDRLVSTVNDRAGKVRDDQLIGVAGCYITLGKIKAAEQCLDGLLDPHERDCWLALLAVLTDQPASLREHVNRLTGGGDLHDSPVPQMLMARAGLLSEADRSLSECRKLWGNDPLIIGFVRVMEAELAWARGQLTQAASTFQEGLRVIENTQTLTLGLGVEALARVHEQKGDWPQAIRVLEAATAERSRTTLSRGYFWIRHSWLLAQLYRKEGRVKDSERIERHLRRLLVCADPDYPLLRELVCL
jgi:tetratricopeptide (TPR) repeat protein